MAVETLDRRVALEEAFDSAEADAKGEVYTPPVREEPNEPETPVVEPLEKDPTKVEAEAEAQPKSKDRPRTRGVPPDERVKPDATAKPEGTQPDTAPKGASNLDKAPLGWGPTRDALWAKTPPEVRSVISKREYEAQNAMSQAGRVRQIAEEYHQVIMPFENIIRSMNTTPREALTNVMQTATALIVGTQAQKCAVITEMVQRYGVDLPQLDTMLTAALKDPNKLSHIGGNPVPQPLDPRLQPLFAMEERLRNAEIQKHENLKAEAATIIQSVQNEPYFEDVKAEIADIMEISANRGYIMTLKEAYTKACQLNPEVNKLIAKTVVKTPINAVARARRAASTVKGSPGGAVTNGVADRRAALEAAWDQNL